MLTAFVSKNLSKNKLFPTYFSFWNNWKKIIPKSLFQSRDLTDGFLYIIKKKKKKERKYKYAIFIEIFRDVFELVKT